MVAHDIYQARDSDDATTDDGCQHEHYTRIRTHISVSCNANASMLTILAYGPTIPSSRSPQKSSTRLIRANAAICRRIRSRLNGAFSFDFPLDIRSSAPIYHKQNGTTCRIAQGRLHPQGTKAFETRPYETSVGFRDAMAERPKGSASHFACLRITSQPTHVDCTIYDKSHYLQIKSPFPQQQ